MADRDPTAAPAFLWPLILGSQLVASQANAFARLLLSAGGDSPAAPPRSPWTTANRVRLALTTMELRDFSRPGSVAGNAATPTLICAPFALHGATIADFAAGHSLVEVLLANGCPRLAITDWRSANRDMRLLGLDAYLAELNVAVDELGPPVDLVGLCQGGVMALIYAARFPAKVRRLVLAAAPIDVEAAPSLLATAAHGLPLDVFDGLVRLGEGRVRGQRLIELWAPSLHGDDVWATLQRPPSEAADTHALQARFRAWFAATLDLPGAYYHQTVLWLFKENRLAAGRLVALGQTVDLATVRQPLFLIAARDDALVAPEQLLAVRRRVGTPAPAIEARTVEGGHLGLFMGARSLAAAWQPAARWLAQS
ncbi:MAG: alpha/beta fold hydrolase [Reyranellaceae bacterium]